MKFLLIMYGTFRRKLASRELVIQQSVNSHSVSRSVASLHHWSVSRSVSQLVGQPVNARKLAGFLRKVPYVIESG